MSPRPALDELATAEVVELLLAAEARVVPAVRGAAPQLTEAAQLVARAVADGRRLVFCGAGTSGRLAAAEAAELPGTFGIDPARCRTIVAGASGAVGASLDHAVDDAAEDDALAGAAAVRELRLADGDVLVAAAASGRTPFTLAAATEASATSAVIAVVTAAGSPLARLAAVAVELLVGDEVLRGSTRLTAGTAQKIALNAITTAAMARAGRVHGDVMIDVVAANAKLRDRAVGIVAEIAGSPVEDAAAALTACAGNARAAVLSLVRGLDPAAAVRLAAAHRSLRAALRA